MVNSPCRPTTCQSYFLNTGLSRSAFIEDRLGTILPVPTVSQKTQLILSIARGMFSSEHPCRVRSEIYAMSPATYTKHGNQSINLRC